jgi:hypothetical protein
MLECFRHATAYDVGLIFSAGKWDAAAERRFVEVAGNRGCWQQKGEIHQVIQNVVSLVTIS